MRKGRPVSSRKLWVALALHGRRPRHRHPQIHGHPQFEIPTIWRAPPRASDDRAAQTQRGTKRPRYRGAPRPDFATTMLPTAILAGKLMIDPARRVPYRDAARMGACALFAQGGYDLVTDFTTSGANSL